MPCRLEIGRSTTWVVEDRLSAVSFASVLGAANGSSGVQSDESGAHPCCVGPRSRA
jgi:hypothetical protein